MTQYLPIHMRTKVETSRYILVVNTCTDNDTDKIGTKNAWSWSNPTNRAVPVAIPGTDHFATSVEALWQGSKVLPGTPGLWRDDEGRWHLSEANFMQANHATLFGDWRRAKGWKPVGAWAGEGLPLVSDPIEARRRVYLPAYAAQLREMVKHPEVRAMLVRAKGYETVYLRDHNTGGIEDRRGMSHAYLLAGWLTNKEFPAT